MHPQDCRDAIECLGRVWTCIMWLVTRDECSGELLHRLAGLVADCGQVVPGVRSPK